MRIFEIDFEEEFELAITDELGGGGPGVDIGGLGRGVDGGLGGVGGLGGGASDMNNLVLNEMSQMSDDHCAVHRHRVAPNTRVAES